MKTELHYHRALKFTICITNIILCSHEYHVCEPRECDYMQSKENGNYSQTQKYNVIFLDCQIY